MKIGSLFAGIGGFDIAARWMGWETAWFSEVEPYANAVLQKHWPHVPNHGDITQIKGETVEPVDLLCGGFPCQDISLAGKGEGIEGSRSGLWSHYARLIEELRPRWVVAENVAALRSRGLDRVLKDLAALGYDAEWHCLPAGAVGAPHQRDRIWIVAYPQGSSKRAGLRPFIEAALRWGRSGHSNGEVGDTNSTGRGEHSGALAVSEEVSSSECRGGTVGDTHSERESALLAGSSQAGSRTAASLGSMDVMDPNLDLAVRRWDSGVIAVGYDGTARVVEPRVCVLAHGVPSRVGSLKAYGNAIVPQVAFILFKAIQAVEDLRNRK